MGLVAILKQVVGIFCIKFKWVKVYRLLVILNRSISCIGVQVVLRALNAIGRRGDGTKAYKDILFCFSIELLRIYRN